jgi:hypothetical protein
MKASAFRFERSKVRKARHSEQSQQATRYMPPRSHASIVAKAASCSGFDRLGAANALTLVVRFRIAPRGLNFT